VTFQTGETKGFVKFPEGESAQKVLAVHRKGGLQIMGANVNVRFLNRKLYYVVFLFFTSNPPFSLLPDDEERIFWEDQKTATAKAQQKKLNFEKGKKGGNNEHGQQQRGKFNGNKRGGKPFGQRDDSKRQKTEDASVKPAQKGNKIELPKGRN